MAAVAKIAIPSGHKSLKTFPRSYLVLDADASTGTSFKWDFVFPMPDDGESDPRLEPITAKRALFHSHTPGTFLVSFTAEEEGSPPARATVQVEIETFEPAITVPNIDADGGPDQATNSEKNPWSVPVGESIKLLSTKSRGPDDMEFSWGVEGDVADVGLTPYADHALVVPWKEGKFKVTLTATALGMTNTGSPERITADPVELWIEAEAVPDTSRSVNRLTDSAREYWHGEQQKAVLDGVKNVRASATAWQGAITTALTLIGALGFIAAPKELADVEGTSWRSVIFGVYIVAVLAGIGAWRKFAEVVDPKVEYGRGRRGGPGEYRDSQKDLANDLAKDVRKGKSYVLFSVVLFVIGSSLMAWEGAFRTDGVALAVEAANGSTRCGPVDLDNGAVNVNGTAVAEGDRLSSVSKCPDDGAPLLNVTSADGSKTRCGGAVIADGSVTVSGVKVEPTEAVVVVKTCTPDATPTATQMLVVGNDGSLRCGEAKTGADGTVTVGGSSITSALTVQIVEKCPSAAS